MQILRKRDTRDCEGLSSLVTSLRSYSNCATIAGYARPSRYSKFYPFLAGYIQCRGTFGRDKCIFVHFLQSTTYERPTSYLTGTRPWYHKRSHLGFEPWTFTCAFVKKLCFCHSRYLEVPTMAKAQYLHNEVSTMAKEQYLHKSTSKGFALKSRILGLMYQNLVPASQLVPHIYVVDYQKFTKMHSSLRNVPQYCTQLTRKRIELAVPTPTCAACDRSAIAVALQEPVNKLDQPSQSLVSSIL